MGQLHLHLFVVQMDLVLEVIVRAPNTLRLEKAGDEHFGEDIVIIALDAKLLGRQMNRDSRIAARRRLGEERRVRLHVVTLQLAKTRKKIGRPRQSRDRVVRLISAKAHDDFAELLAHRMLVFIVRPAQVLSRCGGIHVVFERLLGVLHPVRIGVGPRRRRAEFVVHKEHGPRAFGRGPVERLAMKRDDNRIAVLIDSGGADRIG